MNDLKFAFRQLLKNPGFTAVAVLTLALCLGTNLAIFAVLDAVLVRPLPFPDPDRLVTMFNTYPKAGIERNGASLVNYYERRGNVPAFSHVAILNTAPSPMFSRWFAQAGRRDLRPCFAKNRPSH